MLTHDELYQEMISIAGRYSKLKKHFDNFSHLGEGNLTAKNSEVKGFRFGLDLDNNYFEVFFAGHRIRFSFFMDKFARGVVEVHMRDLLSGDCRDKVGSFSFDERGETHLKSLEKDGDIIKFSDNDLAARFVLLHFVHEAINLEMTPFIRRGVASF
jgi:hypothetical protein